MVVSCGNMSMFGEKENNSGWMGASDVCYGDKKRHLQPVGEEELVEALMKLSLDKNRWSALSEMVKSNQPAVVLDGVRSIRTLLSAMGDIPIQDAVDTGIVPVVVDLMWADSNGGTGEVNSLRMALQFEAAWVLTNIASGNTSQTQVVVEAGGVDQLIRLLRSGDEELREQGMWGLGNIASDRPDYRDQILNHESALYDIVNACKNAKRIENLRTGVWCISNLCRGKPRPQFKQIKGVLPFLKDCVVMSDDANILADGCWALEGLGESVQGIRAILSCDLAPRLLCLLSHEKSAVSRSALRALGQIATGTNEQTQATIDLGFITALVLLLKSPAPPLRKDACWTISNIAAGTTQQLQQLINSGVFPCLMELFCCDEDAPVRMEAAWAIVNACTTTNPEQLESLLNCNCLHAVCETLNSDCSRILAVVLTALDNALTYGNQRASEIGVNPVCQFLSANGSQDKLVQLQVAAERNGNFQLW
eukprot:CAMPEP_0113844516 /NCGR_PEP_ID=MMETSP0372-20130328/277_1 /TAXON_ID=340204 /ORGANISM="Lankesteria abbotti" /LENGTH=478 /DNA_ID=CAMNT_0000813521 /DNA_START=205 /DNA_END=1638 /DNA_ORIENTATION=- /assembly_acc=CAM_ASM_000359